MSGIACFIFQAGHYGHLTLSRKPRQPCPQLLTASYSHPTCASHLTGHGIDSSMRLSRSLESFLVVLSPQTVLREVLR